MKRALASAHLLLISPAVLFLVAVIVQRFQPLQPAHTSQRIVMWYAERMWTLWILLLALPLSVLISGGISLLQDSQRTAQVSSLAQRARAALHPAGATSIAATTGTAAVIVGIVIVHMLAN